MDVGILPGDETVGGGDGAGYGVYEERTCVSVLVRTPALIDQESRDVLVPTETTARAAMSDLNMVNVYSLR